jgi:dTMP kinase
MQQGKLIIMEGADNLGKTTQIEALFSYLTNEKKLKVLQTREPGGTHIGSKIREILLNSKERLPAKTQLLLFEADRSYHYESVIKPHLDKGYIILCDRSCLSTLIYQHKLAGIPENVVYDLNGYATGYLAPYKTFVFHGTMLTTEARDEFEKHTVNKNHEKLNNYYIEYGKVLPNHILINANRAKEVIFEELLSHIEEWI